jgi:predicted O-methyltransferase YrrM
MRTFRHWTLRYIAARILEKQYRRANPGLPWLTQTANQMLDTLLLSQDKGLEFGSGRSTRWFAGRVSHLTSVEHNPQWAERVQAWLSESSQENVDYQLHPGKDQPVSMNQLPDYVCAVQAIAPGSLDFVLVDGIYRDACALLSLDRLKPGGFLILDNANLYLPCRSHSPNSRTERVGAASELWQQFLRHSAGWRRIWTSNHISDTAFFFKPCST